MYQYRIVTNNTLGFPYTLEMGIGIFGGKYWTRWRMLSQYRTLEDAKNSKQRFIDGDNFKKEIVG